MPPPISSQTRVARRADFKNEQTPTWFALEHCSVRSSPPPPPVCRARRRTCCAPTANHLRTARAPGHCGNPFRPPSDPLQTPFGMRSAQIGYGYRVRVRVRACR
eukprot:5264947-Pyramimonas_sp.AAC.1